MFVAIIVIIIISLAISGAWYVFESNSTHQQQQEQRERLRLEDEAKRRKEQQKLDKKKKRLRLEVEAERRRKIASRDKAMAKYLSRLREDPNSVEVQNQLLKVANIFPEVTPEVYDAALDAVEVTQGSSKSKRFALDVGRLHYGRPREDGRPTTYDESAIRNDVDARITKS